MVARKPIALETPQNGADFLDMSNDELLNKLAQALEQSEAEKAQLAAQLQQLSAAVGNLPDTIIPPGKPAPKKWQLPEFQGLPGGLWPICVGAIGMTWIIAQTMPSAYNDRALEKLSSVALSNAELGQSVAQIQGRPNQTQVCVFTVCPGEKEEERPVTAYAAQQTPQKPATPARVDLGATIAQNANLRANPDLNAPVLFTIPQNDRVIPLESAGNWVKVNWVQPDSSQPNGLKILASGYVASALIK